MTRKFSKNSKRGLTLPVAIVISIVLVIVAAGLVFVALSSISTTSVTVNGRQAFMDVRSALEYVESYYRNQKNPDFAMIGDGTGTEYFAAQETTQSAADTTRAIKYVKSSSQPDVDTVKTYVEAVYISSADSGDNTAKLKLTGYSHYADQFGNSGSSVNMSVTFTIGSSGSQRRVTVIDRKERIQYNNATDTIKLNLRMPADLDWKLCYYIWTYYDVTGKINDKDRTGAGAYADYGKNSYFTDSGERIKPDVGKLNASERSNNEYTNMYWDENSGTSGRMVPQANNWFSGDYKIFSDRVNYFNVIFTSEGKVLKNAGDYDSQLNEIFHLWYLYPDDKNVFFEFLNKPKSGGPNGTYYTRYYRGSEWNGKDGLDETILVYLRNQKTTLHFRALNDNKGAYKNEITALDSNPPTISYIANSSDNTYAKLPSFLTSASSETECSSHKKTSGIEMTYEGCGWWVANIETKKTFNIRITYKGVEYALNGIRPIANMVAPDSVPETWLVLRERVTNTSASEKYLEAHVSEKTALSALGELTTSYVTIHAKNYDPDQHDARVPLLSYNAKGIDSTDGRNRLYNKLVEVQMLDESDYENYRSLFLDSGLLQKARDAYNKSDFVDKILRFNGTEETNPKSTLTEKIEEADEEYDKYVSALNEALGKLVQASADNTTLTAFNQLYSQATEYTKHSSLYDSGVYVSFYSVYNSNEVKNAKNGALTKEGTLAQLRRLRTSVTNLEANKLDRTTLASLVTASAKYLQNDTRNQYGQTQIMTLENLLQKDNVVYNAAAHPIPKANDLIKDDTVTTQSDIDEMAAQVSQALSAVRASYIVQGVSTVRIDNLLQQAQNKLDTAVANFTDESKGQLQKAKDDAETAKGTAGVTQDAINTAADKLQLAIYRFDIIKPGVKEDVSTSVADGKTRIWFNTDSSYSVKVKKLDDKGSEIEDVTRYVDTTGNTSGTALGLSCITLTDSTTKKIKLAVTDSSGKEFESGAFDITGLKTTDYLQINYTSNTVTAKQSTVLFIARKVDNQNIGTNITVKAGATELNKATSANYYVFRFPSDAGSISVSALGKDYGSIGTLAAGEHIIWLYDNKAEVVGLDDIYPKPVTVIPEEGPKTSGIVARADDGYEIRQVAKTALETAFDSVKSGMADDEMCLMFNISFLSTDYNIYSHSGESNRNAGWPGEKLKSAGNGFYYCITKKSRDKFIISDKNENKLDKLGGPNEKQDYVIDQRDAKGNMYDCYLIEEKNGGYPITQCKHSDYGKEFTEEEMKNMIGKTSDGETILVINTFDSDHYEFEAPKINVWNEIGGVTNSFTNGPKEMYNFRGLSTYYYYEFPKEYNRIKIEQLGDTSKSTLPTKADGTLYDWYFAYEDSNVIKYKYKDDAIGHYEKEEYKPYDPDEEQTQTTFGETIDVGDISSGQSCIILNTVGQMVDSPYMRNQYYVPETNTWDGETWHGMLQYMSDDPKYKGYHFRIFDNKNTRFSIATGSDGEGILAAVDSKGNNISVENVELPINPYTKELYKYYIITYDSSHKLWFSYYGNDVPNWEFDGADYTATTGHTVDFKYDDIPMAYVGGGKIRVKNYSYYKIYGTVKTNAAGINMGSNSLFGGSGINDNSGNRLGNSMLLPYYDWYEYKIPVDQAEKYDFFIKGIDLDNYDVQTRVVEDAMGDVWVNLFNDDTATETINGTSTKVFDKAELSTFDTDIYQASANVTLYFKLPKDTDYGSSGAAVTEAHGIKYSTSAAKNTARKGFTGLTRAGNTNIFKVEGISKYTPFITVKYEAAGKETKVYNIKLQGGTKVLFNPEANGGLGGWEDFVSDQEALKEVAQNLLDMYATKTIVSGYTSSGDVKSNAKYHESKYVEKLFTNNSYKDYFTKPAGSSTYQLQLSNIMGLSENDAYNAATALRTEYDSLNTLYTLMAQARSYVAEPLTNADGSTYHGEMDSNARYPEYIAAGNNRTYEQDGMDTLRDKLKDAEAAYLDAPSSDVVNTAINELNRAIVNLRVNTAGSIAVVLYDVQDRVDAGHRLQLVYYTHETSREDTYKVTKNISLDEDINSEGYPIVFIENPTGDKIYEVQFYDATEGLPIGVSKRSMESNEAWVYMDFKNNGEWRENAITDFRDITADVYKQSGTSGVKFVMHKVTKNSKITYEDMTLYFKYDTKIEFTDTSMNYTIKSGAYTFQASSTGTPKAPLAKEGDDVVLDLFTAEAKAYFTKEENYKKYTTDALDGKSALWWSNNTFSKAHRSVLGVNVNLDVTKDTTLSATQCSFAELLFTEHYSFSTDKGIYFRWSSPEPLYVGGAGVRMYASEYRLGSVGEINGTDYGTNGTHFYLYAYDSSADQLQISIINDIRISYFDEMNKSHSFVIREGDYIIKKEYKENVFGVREKTEYIADLFNESYWKNPEYVVSLDGGSNTKNWGRGNSGLSNPVYGN